MKAKPDGAPKRTKFIKNYRVLEHLDLAAFKSLYVSSVTGKVLKLNRKPYNRVHKQGLIRTFQEICPLSAMVLSYMTPPEFGEYITDPDQPKGAPKVMFTQIELNIDKFLNELEINAFMDSPIPNVHAHKLRDQILELRANPHKRIKGISLDSVFGKISFLKLRTGFWIARQEGAPLLPDPRSGDAGEGALRMVQVALDISASGDNRLFPLPLPLPLPLPILSPPRSSSRGPAQSPSSSSLTTTSMRSSSRPVSAGPQGSRADSGAMTPERRERVEHSPNVAVHGLDEEALGEPVRPGRKRRPSRARSSRSRSAPQWRPPRAPSGRRGTRRPFRSALRSAP